MIDETNTSAEGTPKRKIKRKMDDDFEVNGVAKKIGGELSDDSQVKKKVKRAQKATKKTVAATTSTAAGTTESTLIAPGVVGTIASPVTTPSKRGRKKSGMVGIISSAPAISVKEDNIALIVMFVKVVTVDNKPEEEVIYSTKIITKNPTSVEEIKNVVMERLTQKKGDSYTFGSVYCNSIDRVRNPIKVEIDEFFFKDTKLNDNDSLNVYVSEK